MKTATAQLLSFLATARFAVIADLFTFQLRSGTFLRYTTLDQSITWSGNTFLTNAPIVKRERVRSSIGIEVAEMELAVAPRAGDLIDGVAWIPAARAGALDGAIVTMERAYIETVGNAPIGVLLNFRGRVSSIEGGRTGLSITVKSELELLNIQMPRNLVQPGCLHTLFDTGCTLTKGSFAVASTVATGSSRTSILCGLAQAAGYFDLGTITFTSGPNNGVSRSVKRYTPGVLTLSFALPSMPSVGNSFNAFPGCDKQIGTCINKFNNVINFKGLPFVPVPETAI